MPTKPEVIPRSVAEKLEAHAKVIHTLITAQRRGAAELFGYAFLAGRALLQAKSIVPNGHVRTPNAGFKRWVEANFPEITMRTAENWMFFAEAVINRVEASAATSPLLLGSIEMSGQSHESVLQLVPEVMNGQGMIRFMRECRLLRTPKRDQPQGDKASTSSVVSGENPAQARRAWERVLKDLDSGTKLLSYVESADDLKRYLNALTEAATKIRILLKRHSEPRKP